MDYEPLHVTFDARPPVIVSQLDDVPRQVASLAIERGRRRWLVWLLLLWGAALVTLDLLFGYPSHLFVYVGAAAIALGLVALVASVRHASPGIVPTGCREARAVIHTLRDDVHPAHTLFGHLDFTGWEKPQKRAFERSTEAGTKVNFYRDEWLALKTKLRDGTGLRVAVVRCVKRRAGFWKRGARRSKWKAATTRADYQELTVRFVAAVRSKEAESPAPTPLLVGRRVGSFKVDECTVKAGIVDVTATSMDRVPAAEDILEVLRLAHELLPGRRR